RDGAAPVAAGHRLTVPLKMSESQVTRRNSMTETTQPPLLTTGRTWQEMPVGLAFRTPGRTMTETALVNFLGLPLYTQPLSLGVNHAAEGGYSARLIPGGLTFIVAEGR